VEKDEGGPLGCSLTDFTCRGQRSPQRNERGVAKSTPSGESVEGKGIQHVRPKLFFVEIRKRYQAQGET